jgi:inward rectifier potassium channel
MSQNRPRRRRDSIGSLSFDINLTKIGARRFDPRDPYHFAVGLSWPAFAIGFVALWLAINLVFSLLYLADPGGVANARPGAFGDVFFFSIETLATVGYGVMAPSSTYAHVVSALEILTGTAFTAIVTGLMFVRFSRPKARILFATHAVVTRHNGHPTLMIRLVNARATPMTAANVRLFALVAETTDEGHFLRRIHDMPLEQPFLPFFVMPWTVMHRIDEDSPLHGHDAESLQGTSLRLFLTIEAMDTVLSANVQDIKDYGPDTLRFGMRYADSIRVTDGASAVADLSRLSLLEPDGHHSAPGMLDLS